MKDEGKALESGLEEGVVGIRRVQRKREQAGQSGKKREFISGQREGDWLLRRSSALPF